SFIFYTKKYCMHMKLFKLSNILSCILLTLLVWYSLSAQTSDSANNSIDERLKRLEDYKQNIENVSKVEVARIANSLQEKFDDDYRQLKLFSLIATILFGGVTLYAIYEGIWGVKSR